MVRRPSRLDDYISVSYVDVPSDAFNMNLLSDIAGIAMSSDVALQVTSL